jgi:hypothetical protein
MVFPENGKGKNNLEKEKSEKEKGKNETEKCTPIPSSINSLCTRLSISNTQTQSKPCINGLYICISMNNPNKKSLYIGCVGC